MLVPFGHALAMIGDSSRHRRGAAQTTLGETSVNVGGTSVGGTSVPTCPPGTSVKGVGGTSIPKTCAIPCTNCLLLATPRPKPACYSDDLPMSIGFHHLADEQRGKGEQTWSVFGNKETSGLRD
jgi:hypothetical protein